MREVSGLDELQLALRHRLAHPEVLARLLPGIEPTLQEEDRHGHLGEQAFEPVDQLLVGAGGAERERRGVGDPLILELVVDALDRRLRDRTRHQLTVVDHGREAPALVQKRSRRAAHQSVRRARLVAVAVGRLLHPDVAVDAPGRARLRDQVIADHAAAIVRHQIEVIDPDAIEQGQHTRRDRRVAIVEIDALVRLAVGDDVDRDRSDSRRAPAPRSDGGTPTTTRESRGGRPPAAGCRARWTRPVVARGHEVPGDAGGFDEPVRRDHLPQPLLLAMAIARAGRRLPPAGSACRRRTRRAPCSGRNERSAPQCESGA